MKKKGFTLIEVLAVIVLLGLIALITVPIIRKTMKDSKQKLYEEQLIQIETGLKNWASSNIFLLPEDNDSIKLSLGQLKQSGFAEKEIKNPKNNKCFSNESILSITKYNNSYIYEVEEIVDVDCNLIENTPTIKLNGNVVEHLKVGDSYIDAGVIALDSSGNDITGNVVTTITGSGTSIDTSDVGTYTITYSITDGGKTMTAIRNVLVGYNKNGIWNR